MNLLRTGRKLASADAWRKLPRYLAGQIYFDRGGDHRDAVFLAGSGRSGTTWLADVLNHDHESRVVYEPFYPKRLRITDRFERRQYLRPQDGDPAYVEPARRILSGRVRSLSMDQYNRRVLPRRRLVKEIYANLLLGWLRTQFHGMPIILLLRHPCAVVASQLAGPWNFYPNPSAFIRQPALMEDHVAPFRDVLLAARTRFERHVAVWCVENYVPLRQAADGGLHVVLYERLVAEPEPELRRLFAFIGKPFDPSVLRRLGRPSAVTLSGSPVASGASAVASWQTKLEDEQVDAAMKLLAAFGLDRLYGRGAEPVGDGASVFA